MKRRWLVLCAPLLLVCSIAAAQTQSLVADRKKVVAEARHDYYSLHGLGMDEFNSTIKPNWEKVLGGQNVTDPAQLQAGLKLLNGLHFTMLMDKAGKVTVTHHADIEPANEQQRQGFNQIYSGLDQTVSGFFTTWSAFMLDSPFPKTESDYTLEDLGSQYRLSYKEGTSDVVTMMSKDLVISSVKVNSPEFISSIWPQFVRTTKGFILSGYKADYKPKSGPGAVQLDVKIDHQLISGMQLPVELMIDSVMDGARTYIELGFSEHKVTNH